MLRVDQTLLFKVFKKKHLGRNATHGVQKMQKTESKFVELQKTVPNFVQWRTASDQ